MLIKEQPMPIDKRLAETSFFNEHWVLFSILLCLIIFVCTITLMTTIYKQKGFKDNNINLIAIAGNILSFILLIALLITTWNVYSNNNNRKYIHYNMTSNIEKVSSTYDEKQDVTITSDADKYHIILPPTVNVKKGDILKISSNGNIITDDNHDQEYINESEYSKGHKLNIKIKKDNTWYPIKAQVYESAIH